MKIFNKKGELLLDLIGNTLMEADLSGKDLLEADLSGKNLRGANFGFANLTGANLSNVDARGAIFVGANLIYANLHGGSFQKAKLNGANLCWTILDNAHFTNASMEFADLRSASRINTFMGGAALDGCKFSGPNQPIVPPSPRSFAETAREPSQQAARFVGVPTWPVASPRCPCCDTLLPRPTAPISQAAVAHLIRCVHPTGAPLPISAAGELVGRGLVERRGNFTMAPGSAIFAATVKGEKMVEFIMASVRDAAFLNDD